MRKVEARDAVFAAHLAAWYSRIVTLRDQFRILTVDRAIADLAADFRSARETPFEDSFIAATGIQLVNPWENGP